MLDSRPIRRQGVVLRREHDDWAMLFDADTGRGFSVNPLTIFIWERLDGTRTVAALVEEVRAAWAQVPAEMDEQVRDLVQRMLAKGLAVVNPPPGAGTETETGGGSEAEVSP